MLIIIRPLNIIDSVIQQAFVVSIEEFFGRKLVQPFINTEPLCDGYDGIEGRVILYYFFSHFCNLFLFCNKQNKFF